VLKDAFDFIGGGTVSRFETSEAPFTRHLQALVAFGRSQAG